MPATKKTVVHNAICNLFFFFSQHRWRPIGDLYHEQAWSYRQWLLVIFLVLTYASCRKACSSIATGHWLHIRHLTRSTGRTRHVL